MVLKQCESLVQCEEGGRTAVPGYSESTSSVIPIETSERPRTEPDERAEPTHLLSAAVPAASANMRCPEVSRLRKYSTTRCTQPYGWVVGTSVLECQRGRRVRSGASPAAASARSAPLARRNKAAGLRLPC